MDSAAIDSFRWSNSLEARFDFNLSLSTSFLIVILVIVVFESCWRKCPPDKTEEVQVDCIVVPLCYTNIYGMAQPNELQTSSHALSAPQRGILDGYESHF